jgi:hypothetical protein
MSLGICKVIVLSTRVRRVGEPDFDDLSRLDRLTGRWSTAAILKELFFIFSMGGRLAKKLDDF